MDEPFIIEARSLTMKVTTSAISAGLMRRAISELGRLFDMNFSLLLPREYQDIHSRGAGLIPDSLEINTILPWFLCNIYLR